MHIFKINSKLILWALMSVNCSGSEQNLIWFWVFIPPAGLGLHLTLFSRAVLCLSSWATESMHCLLCKSSLCFLWHRHHKHKWTEKLRYHCLRCVCVCVCMCICVCTCVHVNPFLLQSAYLWLSAAWWSCFVGVWLHLGIKRHAFLIIL